MIAALAEKVWDVDLGAMPVPAQPSRPKSRVRPVTPVRTVAGLEARRAALRLVQAALTGRGGMDDADGADLAGLEARDRGFARTLALGMLRWKGPIDYLLAQRLRKPPPEPVLRLLHLGLTQMLALDTPAHAAVSTTLALAGQTPGAQGLIKLMNAVLRGVDRERPVIVADHFVPDWLHARWSSVYGDKVVAALSERVVEEPPTDLSLRNIADAEALASALHGQVLRSGTVRTGQRGDVAVWPGFAEGQWWVQDLAAAYPARLLAPSAGQSALDLCAAPGGKTLQLAAMGAVVTALDKSAKRLTRLSENLSRTGLNAEVIEADALTWPDTRSFDAVLLDAPCSATGTFRRHPDVLWTCKPGDIAALSAIQARLLDAAAKRVKPGGRLVYCVCSLEPEEGEGQVGAFLTRRPEMRLDPIRPDEDEIPAGASLWQGALRLLPSLDDPAGGMDGFFIARFRRKD